MTETNSKSTNMNSEENKERELKEMMEKFIDFLQDNGIANSFEANLRTRTLTSIITMERFCRITLPERYITSAFMWSEAPEGENFWRTTSSDWQRHLSLGEDYQDDNDSWSAGFADNH